MNEIQQVNNYSVKKPDIAITDNAFMHCTSVTKEVADRIRAASWEEIRTVKDMGFQMIARVVKDRQEDDDGYQDGED